MIFSGQVGGWPARFNEIFGPEMLGLKFAAIEVEIAPDQTSWRAVIPGLMRAAAEALSGPTSEGKPPRMEHLPGSETGPGQVGTQGKATEDTQHLRLQVEPRRELQQAHHLRLERPRRGMTVSDDARCDVALSGIQYDARALNNPSAPGTIRAGLGCHWGSSRFELPELAQSGRREAELIPAPQTSLIMRSPRPSEGAFREAS
jgi:hypothetical protein